MQHHFLKQSGHYTDFFLFQNELIIQIMTEGYEIDDLKRKVEDAKMKLQTEIKVKLLCSLLISVLFSDVFTICAAEETSGYRVESVKSRTGSKEESVVSSTVCDLIELWIRSM